MSYSISINFELSGVTTPLLPQDYILFTETIPTTINEGETISIKLNADGMYFALQKRKGATATGATLTWNYTSATEAEILLSNPTADVEVTIIAVVKVAPQVVSKPFLYQLAAPVDTRLILTKKEMREANDNYLPDTYFALCKDEGHFYLYNKKSEPNADTGKFTLITDVVETNISGLDGGEII